MRTNKFLANLKAGRKTSLCQLYFPSTTVVELIGLAGLDCVHFDETNLDEIMSVEGIDAYYVGRADMSLSLGFPGKLDHPLVKEAQDKVRQAAHAHGKYYLDDGIVGVRATSIFLDGARLFLEANREALK